MEENIKYYAFIDKDNTALGPNSGEIIKKIEISEDIKNKINTCDINCCWRFVNGNWVYEKYLSIETIKKIREAECFNLLDNRSKFWYDSLTKEQYADIQKWYKAWLDATDTKIIPEKPEWLK